MNEIKISLVWMPRYFLQSIIYLLIEKLSKKKISLVSPAKADLIIYGPYNGEERFYHIYKYLKRNEYLGNNFKKFVENYQNKLINFNFFKRKNRPITLFYNPEILPYDYIDSDFKISGHVGVDDDKHLSFISLKEDIDWTLGYDLKRNHESPLAWPMAKRFGQYLNMNDLLSPQGSFFLKKDRKIAFVITTLNDIRYSIYKIFSKHHHVDGYGKAFGSFYNKKLNNLLENYSFFLCPDHYCIPYYTNSRSAYAFSAKTLPIAFYHQSANFYINHNALINLNNFTHENYQTILNSLKDESFLSKFCNEPYLLKKLNLDEEIKFIKKILYCL
jgi:hypothetical protein